MVHYRLRHNTWVTAASQGSITLINLIRLDAAEDEMFIATLLLWRLVLASLVRGTDTGKRLTPTTCYKEYQQQPTL